MAGTLGLAAGRLELESIVRAPLVVVADPAVAASGPPVTLDELATSGATASSAWEGSPPKTPVSVGYLGGGGARLVERSAGTILALVNPSPGSGLFVWAGSGFVAVLSDPNADTSLDGTGELTVVSGRLVVGAPEAVAAWGPDVDTGDGSVVRARMHRGRQRLGLVVVSNGRSGPAAVATGVGAVAVTFSTGAARPVPLPLAG